MRASEAKKIASDINNTKYDMMCVMDKIKAEAELGRFEVMVYAQEVCNIKEQLQALGYIVQPSAVQKEGDHILFKISWFYPQDEKYP